MKTMRGSFLRQPGRPQAVFALCLSLVAGCSVFQAEEYWQAPQPLRFSQSPASEHTAYRVWPWSTPESGDGVQTVAYEAVAPATTAHPAFAIYAEAVDAEERGEAACVDKYYQAAVSMYAALFTPQRQPLSPTDWQQHLELYNSAVARLIITGQKHERFLPDKRLEITGPDGEQQIVPTVHSPSVWQLKDADELLPVGQYYTEEITRIFRQDGVGAAVVAMRDRQEVESQQEDCLASQHPYSLTVLLRPDAEGQPRLEFVDPLRSAYVKLGGQTFPIAYDLTAPIALVLIRSEDRRSIELKGFFSPGEPIEHDGLLMLEPYQPGKIPIVFVHGLMSGPLTWADMINELRSDPALRSRYQFWLYMYPTGQPFLVTAAKLRQDLQATLAGIDPQQQDVALGEMVLLTHSMGGLLSRLQVARSDEKLWNVVANKPLEEVRTSEETRQSLQAAFFFQPQPFVKRVVFLGTPHHGSPVAKNWIGRIGQTLIQPAQSLTRAREQLLRDNGNIFTPYFHRLAPNSVELLLPDNPLLLAIDELKHAPGVKLHSIIGRGHELSNGEDGDGVVSVESARVSGVQSELLVEAEHTRLHHHPEALSEVRRILHEHLRTSAINLARRGHTLQPTAP